METIERLGSPSVAPFGAADPRDVVYVAAVSCARCGEVNRLVPASAMFLCAWCLRGERSPAATAAASAQRTTTIRRRRISVRAPAQSRRAA